MATDNKRPDIEGIPNNWNSLASPLDIAIALCAYALRLEEEIKRLDKGWQKANMRIIERACALKAAEKRIADLLPMTEYGLIGAGFSFDRMKNPGPSSFTGYAHGQSITKAQYDAARAAVEAEKQTPYDLTNDLADMEREEGYEEGGGGQQMLCANCGDAVEDGPQSNVPGPPDPPLCQHINDRTPATWKGQSVGPKCKRERKERTP